LCIYSNMFVQFSFKIYLCHMSLYFNGESILYKCKRTIVQTIIYKNQFQWFIIEYTSFSSNWFSSLATGMWKPSAQPISFIMSIIWMSYVIFTVQKPRNQLVSNDFTNWRTVNNKKNVLPTQKIVLKKYGVKIRITIIREVHKSVAIETRLCHLLSYLCGPNRVVPAGTVPCTGS